MMRTSLPLKNILEARSRISKYLKPSPLVFSAALSEISGARVWLKLENLQPTGSFKVRGALNMLAQAGARAQATGIVTGSAGNHGLGVAFAAQSLGMTPVTIVIPHTAPESKKARLARFSIDIIEQGETYELAHQAALSIAQENQWTYVPAYDDEDVIAGQGTIGLEIMEACPAVETIMVPVGGGGLIAGIANAVKQMNPVTEVIGIQAAASPAAQMSLRDGQPYDPYEHQPTIADGLAGGFGKLPFYLSRMSIDRIMLASEIELREAVIALLEHEQIIAEPSGAVSVHPLIQPGQVWAGRTVVCVISGGNLAISLLRDILC